MFKYLGKSDEFWLGWDIVLIPWIFFNLVDSIADGDILWVIVQSILLPLIVVITVLTWRRISKQNKFDERLHEAFLSSEPFVITSPYGVVYEREEGVYSTVKVKSQG